LNIYPVNLHLIVVSDGTLEDKINNLLAYRNRRALGVDVRIRAFRTFVQDGGEGSTLRLCHFTATFIDQTRGQVVTLNSNRLVTAQYFVLVCLNSSP
jgi:hypothetical protein